MSCPRFRRQLVNLPIGGRGQAREDVTQVREGIETTPPAALDDGVQDGATLAGFGVANEHPILFAESRRADGVLHEVLVDFDATVSEINAELRPQVQGVGDGHPHSAAWQVASFQFEPGEDSMQSGVNGFGLVRTQRGA